MKTGFVGLGAMGLGMARNLHRAGLLAGVWNRTPEKALALAAETGTMAYAGAADLAAACDVIVTCVSADADALEVIGALAPTLRPGAVVVDCSTVGVATARRAAEVVRQAGGDFLDAPVSGGVEGACSGTLALMVGGRAEAVEKVRPVLEAMGNRIMHMGDTGAGQATKAVNQVMCAGINQAVTEALAFGQALGLDLDKVIDVVSGGAAGNWFLDKRGKTMIRGSFQPGFKLALHHKDLNICLEMAERLGIPLPLSTQTRDDYAELMARGHGEDDISGLFRLKSAARPKG
ncbi:NAD(P)-dependent oxidoreductase [Methylococcus geothermalis]|uniref:NAD-binding protein n=1 Tax=Methylococcus geothermalis TaxID=2681310 RepID=A0A858Q748_9GAMM|nr:NAD(P)-dependent oxidoreductase [Methylococcus geothermalis]QJD29722.1 NAD-binding protein [Methylococcus geothermalis]